MTGGAVFSRDRRYRYRLWRRWDRARPLVAFVMLNPSTADGRCDDPTIRRCVAFARSWGFGGAEIVNLFAYRATDPRALLRVHDPVGRRNGRYLRSAVFRAALVVAAWGANTLVGHERAAALAALSPRRPRCLGVTRDGHPRHPLYLRSDVRPQPFRLLRRSAA